MMAATNSNQISGKVANILQLINVARWACII